MGGAGMVVATRLANASSSSRILLLEVGGEPSVLNDIPTLCGALQNQPGNTFFYNSTPQVNACQNCDGKKSEDYNGNYARDPASAKYHGKGGLLNVAKYDFEPGADDFFGSSFGKGICNWRLQWATQEVHFQPPKAVGVTYKRQGHTRTVTANPTCDGSTCWGKNPRPREHPCGTLSKSRRLTRAETPHYVDLQLIHTAFALYPQLPQDFNHKLGIRIDILDKWFDPYHKLNTDARFAFVVLGRPKSFGKLMLASTNPDDNPIIDPKFLTHSDDVEALLYGLKKFVDLYENTAALNTPLFHKPVPGCENKLLRVMIIIDASSACSLSLFTIMWAPVLWEKLVMGIDGLRVIDASVIPRLPNGNTQAATIMIAEKGSDLIISEQRARAPYPSQFKVLRATF
ncbi:Choline dehydrogenase, mitochondrial [Orchesella cincta]|uniref:Choline dehydrogenase, mitochondrial n=1 Tax=Orchesella cincta TaxID=48709 RepID=A0A1D2MAV4_ORCCI|nr:Choline dehydrogenase, mitochondrial [Orchesella cincta]